MNIALIVSGGKGLRLGSDIPKQYLKIGDKTILQQSCEAFTSHSQIDKVFCVINSNHKDLCKTSLGNLDVVILPVGGTTRQKSVYNGLKEIAKTEDNITNVLIHDAARPFIAKDTIDELIKELKTYEAVLPTTQATSTIKISQDGENVDETIDRQHVFLAQTPQCFCFDKILELHKKHSDKNLTDDVALFELEGLKVKMVKGKEDNIKITTREDYEKACAIVGDGAFPPPNPFKGRGCREAGAGLPLAQQIFQDTNIKIGLGYDLHRFEEEDGDYTIKLGGFVIPHNKRFVAHSDGDVVIHALFDAITGALGDKDIGTYFSNTDSKWKNADSKMFLLEAKNLLKQNHAKIGNIDIVLICETPKISKYREDIINSLASILDISENQINIKGKTQENLGEIGRGKAVACYVNCLLHFDYAF